MAWNDFAAGMRLYGAAGSTSANGGKTLDPSGFISRELNKPRGMRSLDGQSDARSGLAAGALDRIKNLSGRTSPLMGRTSPAARAQNSQGIYSSPVDVTNRSTNFGGALSGPKMGSSPRSTTAGQIKIPMDDDLWANNQNALREYYNTKNQNLDRADEVGRNFQINQGQTREQAFNALLELGNNYSGRGMTFSGGQQFYDDKTRDSFNNQLKQLQYAAQQQMNELARSTQTGMMNLDNTRNSSMSEQLYRNTQKAKGWTR